MIIKQLKVFSVIVLMLVLALSLLWWRYDVVSEKLGYAIAEKKQLIDQVRLSEQSIQVYQQELERRESLLNKRESSRREVEMEILTLKESLNEARTFNKEIADCWDVSLGVYADRLQQFTESNEN